MSIRSRARTAASNVLRPFWLIIWRRIEARIQVMPTVPPISDTAWQQHMPAFLNAVSTVGAFGHELARHRRDTEARFASLAARLDELAPLQQQLGELSAALRDAQARFLTADGRHATLAERHDSADRATADLQRRLGEIAARIEFVRSEILYEMRYAPAGLGASTAPESGSHGPIAGPVRQTLEPKVLSQDKLDALPANGLRVNLGCGHIPVDDYINVDMRALPGVDIVAEAGNLPLEPGTLRELRSAHLLEHFPQEELRRRLLPYWFSLLAPGGRFTAIVPDGEAMVGQLAAGSYEFESFRQVLFGAQDYNGDFHFNLFEPRSIRALLEEAGFTDIDIPVSGRRNGLCFELEVHATRP